MSPERLTDGCRVFLAACAFGFLLVAAGSAAPAAPQKKQPARPASLSREVRAACDFAYDIAAKTPGVSIRRRIGTFRDETLRQPVFGCGLNISGSFAKADESGDAANRLHIDFSDAGWQEMFAYMADGTDGTSFAFRKAGVACLVRGTWNGGAEPDLPAEDWYKVTLFCTSPPFPESRR